jgi:ABC-type bacteriocin/lantibiotic exporter with double-glycine peptidase domain
MSRRVSHLIAYLLPAAFAMASEPHGVWLEVPFVAQEKNGCGAASVAMVMQYWHRQQEQSANIDAQKIHMERYLREHGFRTFAIKGEWTDLEQHLRQGRPLIVALKSTGADLHYVVVAGVDSHFVLKHDPAVRRLLKQRRADFEKEWKGANNWTLLALPHSNLPSPGQ